VGRVFNGLNFSPITGITVELRQNGSLVDMRDNNWHNPYTLIADTNGNFTFWPKPVAAETMNTQGLFEYTVRIAAPNFAERIHVFSVSLISEPANSAISLSKTFKLPDIFLFPPGEEQHRLIIDE
jgi:competence protein ComFB